MNEEFPVIWISDKTANEIGNIFRNCESLEDMVQFLTPNFDKYLHSLQVVMNEMADALTLSATKSVNVNQDN